MNILKLLALPGITLIKTIRGRPDPEPYYGAVYRVYVLLSRMHDEVLRRVNEARLSTDLNTAKATLHRLLNWNELAGGFRTAELCDQLEAEGRTLVAMGAVPPGSALDRVIPVLLDRERGLAELYSRELSEILDEASKAESLSEFRGTLNALRSELLRQQGEFMTKADQALELSVLV
jgi:HPt (histidine-containing phosphotransfer) domain-containing protein